MVTKDFERPSEEENLTLRPAMKTQLLLALALFTAAALRAEELQAIPPEELAKATQLLAEASAQINDLALKLELAPDQAAGFKAGDVGALLIPDKRFKAERGGKADRKKTKGEVMPVGQLWTLKLSPKEKEAVLPNDKLRLVKVNAKDKELELALFTLGIEKAAKQEFQLVVYGKGSQPVLRVPLTVEKNKGAAPVIMSARKTGEEAGVIELKLLGHFKAEIPMGKQAE